MFNMHRSQTALLAVIAVALLAPTASVAQHLADRDTREISSYVLTEAGLAKYTQATRNLGALAKRMSDACDDGDDGQDTQSLDDAVAHFDAIPGVRAAIKSAGMTTREYIVFTWSLFQNGMAALALDQPGAKLPPSVSMPNVTFYRKHETALKKLGEETKPADCGEN